MMPAGHRHARAAVWCILAGSLAVSVLAREIRPPAIALAEELSHEGDHQSAATEFWRLALEAKDASERGAFHWSAAYEYWRTRNLAAVDQMLSLTESEAPELGPMILLLRTEKGLSERDWSSAASCSKALLDGQATNEMKVLAARKLAVVRLRERNLAGARDALARSPVVPAGASEALDRYSAGSDKNPMVGGLLGLIPGFGYFYSGEWSNGFRSLVLNGLCIYGMVDTGRGEEWGGFALITAVECVWYSGSIYGGIDAAHRHNRRRLDSAVNSINDNAGFEPDYGRLPVLVLKFDF